MDELLLSIHGDVVEDGLDRVSSLLVATDFYEVALNQMKDVLPLVH